MRRLWVDYNDIENGYTYGLNDERLLITAGERVMTYDGEGNKCEADVVLSSNMRLIPLRLDLETFTPGPDR